MKNKLVVTPKSDHVVFAYNDHNYTLLLDSGAAIPPERLAQAFRDLADSIERENQPKYRLLTTGEKFEPGDEYFDAHRLEWTKLTYYEGIFQETGCYPTRRRMN
jgi:hypothetical protein